MWPLLLLIEQLFLYSHNDLQLPLLIPLQPPIVRLLIRDLDDIAVSDVIPHAVLAEGGAALGLRADVADFGVEVHIVRLRHTVLDIGRCTHSRLVHFTHWRRLRCCRRRHEGGLAGGLACPFHDFERINLVLPHWQICLPVIKPLVI